MKQTSDQGTLAMPSRDYGFTLIETIVALVIFAGVFFALSGGMAGGWRGVRLARMDAAAAGLARAKLAAIGIESPLEDAQLTSGVTDGFDWRVDVQRYPGSGADTGRAELAAYWVSIEVSWRENVLRPERVAQLKGLKLGTRP